MADFGKARALLREFKGDSYLQGMGVLTRVGPVVTELGTRAALVRDAFPGSEPFLDKIRESLAGAGVELVAEIDGAAPNAPLEDLARITTEVQKAAAEVVVSFGGGSTIDVAKAAIVLCNLGGEIEDYFGMGMVSEALKGNGKDLTPHVAIQTAASSGAHLTKYSNITDVKAGQKKLIVDEAVVPARPVFDYEVTAGAPASLTADGALDGIAHCWETLLGAVGKDYYEQLEAVAQEGVRLVVEYLPRVMDNPADAEGREALGLATDLGGYAIMLGGTNGPHLTSFSLVDLLSHGRACAITNPYYTVFFAPAVEQPLKVAAAILAEGGYIQADLAGAGARDLGVAVAEGLIAFEKEIGFPTTLSEVPGFRDAHIERALTAAKNPQLKMKLENMPVPLTAEMVDEYMGPVLQAAKSGDLGLIKNVT